MIFHKQSQAGVTLVELMIGLTIGLIVVGAAMAILFSNQTMLIQKQKVDRTQEELRFAITTITRLVRQANSFSSTSDNEQLVINFDSKQRDCLGEPNKSTVNTLKLVGNEIVCVRDFDPTERYVLAKNITDVQFTYGLQSSTGGVQYCLRSETTCLASGTTWAAIFPRITSVRTRISIAQQGVTKDPTLYFVATSHTKSGVGNVSSGAVPPPPPTIY